MCVWVVGGQGAAAAGLKATAAYGGRHGQAWQRKSTSSLKVIIQYMLLN